MLFDALKLLAIVIGLTVLVVVERVMGLPVWFWFCLWLIGRKKMELSLFLYVWVIGSIVVSSLYNTSLAALFLLTLLPLTTWFHGSWWKSQTLGLVGTVLGPILFLAGLTHFSGSVLSYGYLVLALLLMIILSKSWFFVYRPQPAGLLKIEWKRLEAFRGSA